MSIEQDKQDQKDEAFFYEVMEAVKDPRTREADGELVCRLMFSYDLVVHTSVRQDPVCTPSAKEELPRAIEFLKEHGVWEIVTNHLGLKPEEF